MKRAKMVEIPELLEYILQLPADVKIDTIEFNHDRRLVTIYVRGESLGEEFECKPGQEPQRWFHHFKEDTYWGPRV